LKPMQKVLFSSSRSKYRSSAPHFLCRMVYSVAALEATYCFFSSSKPQQISPG